MNCKIALFIGAPSTGKTSVLKALESKSYTVFDEISRQITIEARHNGIAHLFKEQPLLFSEKLLEGRIEQFNNAKKLKHEWSFIDRGLPDITAYLNMIKQPYPRRFIEANHTYKYDKVFCFPLWEDIYKTDEERYEDYETAKVIENHLLKSYEDCGYEVITIPKTDINNRIEFIISTIENG